jgi:hypothetical protein
MLMYSSAAICASLRPWATRATSSRSRALSRPLARRGRLRLAGVGEHQSVLGGGGRAHRRAAFFGGTGPGRVERTPDPAQRLVPAAGVHRHLLDLVVSLVRGHGGPRGEGLGETPGRAAQVPAAVQAVAHRIRDGGAHRELKQFPQVHGGILDTARFKIQIHHNPQQAYQGPLVTHVAGAGPVGLEYMNVAVICCFSWWRTAVKRRSGTRA